MAAATPLFDLSPGSVPLLVSIPHLGLELPDDLRPGYSDEAFATADADWHLDRLYADARALGASMLCARVSRYVIDLNRPPDGSSLYPGQTTTGLCPTETFRGVPLYRPGAEPDAAERARRRSVYWQPYHDALDAELQRLRAEHGFVLLWEAHSIASVLPRLFDGKLPDLNFGTNDGHSCAPPVLAAVLAALDATLPDAPARRAVNGRFKGGYITRSRGRPAEGVQAIQLEMCQSVYMDEDPPFGYRPDLASQIQPSLRAMLEAFLAAGRRHAA